jgi:hypothetical protein
VLSPKRNKETPIKKKGNPHIDHPQGVEVDVIWHGFHGYRTHGYPQTGQPPGVETDDAQNDVC